MIFKDVIDKFFEKEYDDFDVFFLFCNENWMDNPAFCLNDKNNELKCLFDEISIENNIKNLLRYFKHKNYKKIDNKPIFGIHQPYEITDDEIKLFYDIANKMLVKNGFDGIELIINCVEKKYENYINYYNHANYKTNKGNSFQTANHEEKICYIQYDKYVTDFLINEHEDNEENINTIFTNFDNSVRFLNHKNKQFYITKTINNNIEYFEMFLNIQFNKYEHKKNEILKIFIINAWNEWGEQMTIEPSNEDNFMYLEIIKKKLLEYFLN